MSCDFVTKCHYLQTPPAPCIFDTVMWPVTSLLQVDEPFTVEYDIWCPRASYFDHVRVMDPRIYCQNCPSSNCNARAYSMFVVTLTSHSLQKSLHSILQKLDVFASVCGSNACFTLLRFRLDTSTYRGLTKLCS